MSQIPYPRIVLIGGDGQLAFELREQLGSKAIPLGRSALDITNENQLDRVLRQIQPTAVINCSAYNKVDLAQDEPRLAEEINAAGPGYTARWCAIREVPLVQVSTDHVFGQSGTRPWKETDEPLPQSVYGRTKREGELRVLAVCPSALVVRTCGLYGKKPTAVKGNFVETMLRLAETREELMVVADQHCTPSHARDIATGILGLLERGQRGLWHLTAHGETTWALFAAEIFRQAGLKTRVIPITTEQFEAKAPRPKYSVLDLSRAESVLGPQKPWQQQLTEYLTTRRR